MLFLSIVLAQESQISMQLQSSSILQNPIEYRVMQLLGAQDYRVNQKFISRLFSNQGHFLDNQAQPDLLKIARTLKQNGLLGLKFKQPMELEIAFVIDENPEAFISALYDVLDAMGYYYFLVKQSLLQEKQFKFMVSMNTEYAIDPTLLQEKLHEYGYKIQSIERTNLSQWNYHATLLNFKMPKATALMLDQTHKSANLKGEYWYAFSEGESLDVRSSNNTAFYPKIVFFDAQLKIVGIFSARKLMRQTKYAIPKGAKFAKITDAYLPITIKNGLDVTLQ